MYSINNSGSSGKRVPGRFAREAAKSRRRTTARYSLDRGFCGSSGKHVPALFGHGVSG